VICSGARLFRQRAMLVMAMHVAQVSHVGWFTRWGRRTL